MSSPARTGKVEEVLALAEPHLPAIGRPMRNALMRQHATIGDGAVKDRARRRRRKMPELGMDAVRRNDDVAFGDDAVGERHPRDVAGLLEADAAMSGVHHARRQALASISTRSARCMPNVAFQPAESVT